MASVTFINPENIRISCCKVFFICKEEHSMDQCRSRLKLSENFERHWSIQISGEIHMDQSMVHMNSWGNSYGPMVLKVLLKFPPCRAYTGIGPWMALPRSESHNSTSYPPRTTGSVSATWKLLPRNLTS